MVGPKMIQTTTTRALKYVGNINASRTGMPSEPQKASSPGKKRCSLMANGMGIKSSKTLFSNATWDPFDHDMVATTLLKRNAIRLNNISQMIQNLLVKHTMFAAYSSVCHAFVQIRTQ